MISRILPSVDPRLPHLGVKNKALQVAPRRRKLIIMIYPSSPLPRRSRLEHRLYLQIGTTKAAAAVVVMVANLFTLRFESNHDIAATVFVNGLDPFSKRRLLIGDFTIRLALSMLLADDFVV